MPVSWKVTWVGTVQVGMRQHHPQRPHPAGDMLQPGVKQKPACANMEGLKSVGLREKIRAVVVVVDVAVVVVDVAAVVVAAAVVVVAAAAIVVVVVVASVAAAVRTKVSDEHDV